jgi:hypothetical protein
MVALVLPLASQGTRADSVSDREVKAAMLYNFTKFVEWPGGPPSDGAKPLTICVVGRDPFGSVLEQAVADRTVNGKPVRVARSQPGETKGCQIVFLSSSESNRVGEMLDALTQTGVLTVSDIEGFAREGGVIGFVLEDSKVRFEINLEAAERARLKISARLLKLATVVKPAGGRTQ